MRIEGFASSSYPIKRAPRKRPAASAEVDEDLEGEFETQAAPARAGGQGEPNRASTLPARQRDMIFPRACSRRTAQALASYLNTAGFGDWEHEVLGLDLYI
ncbi:hypothetical protein [Pseudomonas sp. R5(2019)]|uniref:hypothetical protein n=1 Tax=Pseudomonas sp. R5(2019) TaxID=2697566 RepID=UPI00141316D2|nr:hypothetical protein [Pseudomonas sp. R5(2019)]NBA94514.1 hypothetical protein [Pseudomonas sp. R5(2019)]